jgi:hypothetical protein
MLDNAVKNNPGQYHFIGTNQYGGSSYEFPRNLLRLCFCKPISEEKHKEMSERAKAENMVKRLQIAK